MSIYLTGDTHGDFTRFSSSNFPRGKELNKNDYIIILGDFGGIWNYKGLSKTEEYWLNWLNEKPWTTLFIDGNHENFNRLNDYPTFDWHGGKVHRIKSNIFHLCRGQVFDIEGLTFLAMGGANSHDIQDGILNPSDYSNKKDFKQAIQELEKNHKLYRIKDMSWWAEEVPNALEKSDCILNMYKHNKSIDYVLTHETPASINLYVSIFPPTEYSQWLEKEIKTKIRYKQWFFGHYHLNRIIDSHHSCLYDKIIQIK